MNQSIDLILVVIALVCSLTILTMYVSNIIKLVRMIQFSEYSLIIVLRFIGIFMVPLGVIMGFISTAKPQKDIV
jgi:hypothetical protein